jgi:hypothetical protein
MNITPTLLNERLLMRDESVVAAAAFFMGYSVVAARGRVCPAGSVKGSVWHDGARAAT